MACHPTSFKGLNTLWYICPPLQPSRCTSKAGHSTSAHYATKATPSRKPSLAIASSHVISRDHPRWWIPHQSNAQFMPLAIYCRSLTKMVLPPSNMSFRMTHSLPLHHGQRDDGSHHLSCHSLSLPLHHAATRQWFTHRLSLSRCTTGRREDSSYTAYPVIISLPLHHAATRR